MIDQLRLYRMVNPNITSCVGFAFPKLPENGTHLNNQRSPGTQKKFCFVYELQPLILEQVCLALAQALTMNEDQFRQLPVTHLKEENVSGLTLN